MKDEFRIEILNSLSGLTEGAGAMREFLERAGVSAEVAFALDLAYEELLTNTIKYAYRDNDTHRIGIVITVDADAVELEVIDDGEPFDPTVQEAPNTSLPVDERPLGGLGLHLIKNLTDAFTYRRDDEKNCVKIRKRRI